LVQRNHVPEGETVHKLEVGSPAYRPDHGGATPSGQLGGQRADAAEDPMDENRQPVHRGVGEHGPVGREARDAEAGAHPFR
jgi:hypothetical protein